MNHERLEQQQSLAAVLCDDTKSGPCSDCIDAAVRILPKSERVLSWLTTAQSGRGQS